MHKLCSINMMVVSSVILLRVLLLQLLRLLLLVLGLMIVLSNAASRVIWHNHFFRRIHIGFIHHVKVVIKILRVQEMRVIELIIVEIVHPLMIMTIEERSLLLVELLQVLFHFQMTVKVNQALSHDPNQIHLVHQYSI